MSDAIRRHVLRDGQTEVTVLSLGCCVQDWQVAGRRVVLGYADPEDYRANPKSMGMTVGRVANRISGGRFTLDGRTWDLPRNSGPNTIHGGPDGFGKRLWRMQPEGARAVTLHLASPHLDQGFPGALEVSVRLTLDGAALTWEMLARPDRPTPVNLCQHLYFNLALRGDIRDHRFHIAAERYTPTDAATLPTGEILPVAGTRYDFRAPQRLAEIDPGRAGYDLNFALDGGAGPAATAESPDGMRLRLWTDRPGLQFYTGAHLTHHGTPWPGVDHAAFGGFCMEAQDFPDAVNRPGFPPTLCTPDHPYRQRTTIEIAPT